MKLSLIATNVILGFFYLFNLIQYHTFWLTTFSIPYDFESFFQLIRDLVSFFIVLAILALIIINVLQIVKNKSQNIIFFASAVVFFSIVYFIVETFDQILFRRRLSLDSKLSEWTYCWFTGCLNNFDTYSLDMSLIGSLISLFTTIFIILNLLLSIMFNRSENKS